MGVNASIEGSNPSFSVSGRGPGPGRGARRGGRAVECGGLENRYGSLGSSRVQIPPSPLESTRRPDACPAGSGHGRKWRERRPVGGGWDLTNALTKSLHVRILSKPFTTFEKFPG